ncbi:MAG: hypothetical protein D6731_14910, partial [Planctomycetota bacterium]
PKASPQGAAAGCCRAPAPGLPAGASGSRARPAAADAASELDWLCAQQRRDGSFGARPKDRFWVTAFVLTAIADSRARELEAAGPLQRRAANFLIAHQDPDGAFRAGGRDGTVLALLALSACQEAAPSGLVLGATLPLLPPRLRTELAAPSARTTPRSLLRCAWRLHRLAAPPGEGDLTGSGSAALAAPGRNASRKDDPGPAALPHGPVRAPRRTGGRARAF